MKVAFVTDNDEYSWIWKQNYSLFNRLKDQGLDIDLINLYVPIRFRWSPKWKQIKSDIFNNYYLSLLFGVAYIFPNKLKKILKEWGYTHVILWHQFLGYLYPALSKLNIKRIIIVHDLCLFYKENKGVWDIVYEKLLMKNLDKFENLVFISNFTKKDYIKYYNNLEDKNYKIIYQWIDKQELNNDLRELLIKKYNLKNKKIFINVWSEDFRKNIITYLKIAEHYKDNKELLFIRIWKPSSDSQKYINEHKLNNILYCSWISDEELVALYSLSNAVISTSSYEWYWRQIFEWYLYCKNVITSNVSDVVKIFEWDESVNVIHDYLSIRSYINAIESIINECNHKKTSKIQSCKWETKEYYEFLHTSIR